MKHVLKSETGGVALVLVIWVLVVLVAIVGEFSYSMKTEINIVRNFKEEEEAYQLALAGVEAAKLELLSVKDNAIAYFKENNVLVLDDLRAFKDDEEKEPVRNGTLGNVSYEYTLYDEDSKLNINTASRDTLKTLFSDSGVDSSEVDTIVDSIIDWRDTNEEHHLNGAEEDYYRSLDIPYSCKDGPFDSIEELLRVKGMTREILYGSKKEGDEEDNEEASDDEEVTYEGVDRYLTVYGSIKININTASESLLDVILGPEAATNVISQRETGPILNAQFNNKITSEYFTIISTGTNADGKIKRSIKTTVLKRNNSLETLYWNDNLIG